MDRAVAWSVFLAMFGNLASTWEGRESFKKNQNVKVLRMEFPVSRNVPRSGTSNLHTFPGRQLAYSEKSKKLPAPDPTGGSKTTYWFYERSRGSYEELKRLTARTPVQKKNFEDEWPKKQKFDKLKLGDLLISRSLSWFPSLLFLTV